MTSKIDKFIMITFIWIILPMYYIDVKKNHNKKFSLKQAWKEYWEYYNNK